MRLPLLLGALVAHSVLAIVTANAVGAGERAPFYIGTYTAPDGSRGIYRSALDLATGTLAEPVLAVEVAGPSYLTLAEDGKRLYAVHEPGGQVSAFAVEGDGALRLLNSQSTQGAGPCHLSLDRRGGHLFVANYGGGSLACLPVREDGTLAPASATFANEGQGPNARRQEKPHLHYVTVDAENRHVYACDLGTDEVLVFEYDAEAGTLTSASPRSAKVPAGGGPRHLALHPSGKSLFVNNELTSSVTAFTRDAKTGALTPKETLSTLPGGRDVPGNTTAAIMLHPNGKWLYVSNRGHDSLALFEVGETGSLTLIEIAPAGVEVPRGFAIDPTGKWLVVGGQNSNDLTTHAIDPATGRLSPGPNRISVGKPVCVAFPAP